MNDKYILEVKKLDFYRGKLKILNNINLSIRAGEIVTIVGPNGSGKTSLLSILAGIIPVSQTCYSINKGLVIGYMPQNINFDPVLPITVLDFLCLINSQDNIGEIAQEVGIVKILDKNIYEISRGELQRVLLANCLMREPQLMILDEPVSSMDINSSTLFYNLISSFCNRTNCSIIMASHDLYVVMKNTDRVLCLDGKICCEGKPHEIVTHKEFINLFGKNIALYEHDHE